MATSTITSKGQITIPAKVRTDMGLSAGGSRGLHPYGGRPLCGCARFPFDQVAEGDCSSFG
ncbi:AbrB/MazE/SpoVT family DNA-binding domain-containing protein [Sinorhizobium meliloti]|nr:AbrB/MazE/SpoVT family DNA-binding domain-containing protein [Sinorhizobium meliloti]